MSKHSSRISDYIFGILVALLLTVLLVKLVMSPPASDLMYLVLYLSLTSLGSAIFGFLSHRLGWWRRLPRLSYALIMGYILAGGLTLFNVWVTARLMFLNQHDLALGSLLLLFAGGISVAFGFFLSNAIVQALGDLVQGAEKLSQGNFAARVSIHGKDEVAQLAVAFNQMAARLEQTAEAEHALDAARRNLVAWASHDLRTPLTSIRVMVDALADGVVTDPETVSRYLRQSQSEIDRLSKLIDDLFELAQLDAGYQDLDFEWITLSDLVSDALESFAARAEAQNVILEGHVDPEVDPIFAAPDKLSRILDNLIGNALRDTPKDGKIKLHATIMESNTQIVIEDTGTGISPNDLPHIFDRFYRGEKSRARQSEDRGVGLGLAIVKGLVEAHGGKIEVESELDHGTRFWITLPRRSR